MPNYQVEIFRTTQDQATITLQAQTAQDAELLAGQMVDDLSWEVTEENFTCYSQELPTQSSGYTSMASVLTESQNPTPQEEASTSTYTPLLNR